MENANIHMINVKYCNYATVEITTKYFENMNSKSPESQEYVSWLLLLISLLSKMVTQIPAEVTLA